MKAPKIATKSTPESPYHIHESNGQPSLPREQWNTPMVSIKRLQLENKQKGNGTNCKCQDPISIPYSTSLFTTCEAYLFRHIKGRSF